MKSTKKVTVSKRALEASFVVSHMIAKNMKAHTIGESLLKPTCEEMARIIQGDEAVSEIDKVPLSDNTVARRISELSRDIEELTLQKIKSFLFALQTDEASDCSSKCHLLTFVRFVDGHNIIDQFLFMKMKTIMTGEDIFHIVDTFFTCHKMLWDHCVGICTDGAPGMTDYLRGFVTTVKAKNPLIISTHCFLYRETNVTKTMKKDLLTTLNNSVHVVNYTKGKPLKN